MLGFHVTRRQSLAAILEKGLEPRTGANATEMGEAADAIYCFASMDSCEEALMNWLGERFDEDDALVVLTLRLDGLSLREEEVEWEIAVTEPVSKDRVVAAVDELGKPIDLAGEAC